ncbi:MAG: S8 family serine peptidase [Microcoleaceae cyanobacterium]
MSFFNQLFKKSLSKKRTFQETFILEPTLNPSAIIDVGDESYDLTIIDIDLPDEIESEVDLEDETLSEGDLTSVEASNSDEVDTVEIPFTTDLEEVDIEDHDIEDNPKNSEDYETKITDSKSNSEYSTDQDVEIDSKVDSEGEETSENLDETASDSNENTDTLTPDEKTVSESTLPGKYEGEEIETNPEDSLDESKEAAEESNHSDTKIDSDNETDIVEETPSSPINFNSGTFTVGETGEVQFDYLFDGGKYSQGELAIFSLEGMEELDPNSEEFIQEATRRALSDSELGYVVISDASEGAKFSGELGEEDFNQGEYLGVKTFNMNPGDEFAVMLIPNGKVEDVLDNPNLEGSNQPLFSLSTANPDDRFQFGQIADVTGDGNTFVFEDVPADESDRDYNDMMFQIRGATGEAVNLDEVISDEKDWRSDDMGQALIEYEIPYITPEDPIFELENDLLDLAIELEDSLDDGESETEIEADEKVSNSETIDEIDELSEDEESPNEVIESEIDQSVVEIEDNSENSVTENSSPELETVEAEENISDAVTEETNELEVVEIEDNLENSVVEESDVVEIEDNSENSVTENSLPELEIVEPEENVSDAVIEETDESEVVEIEEDKEIPTVQQNEELVVLEAEDNAESEKSQTEPKVINNSSDYLTVEETEDSEVIQNIDNSDTAIVEVSKNNLETPLAEESNPESENIEIESPSETLSTEEIQLSENIEIEDNLDNPNLNETEETELIETENISENSTLPVNTTEIENVENNFSATSPTSTVESPTVNLVNRLENLTQNLQNQTVSETPVNSNLVEQLEQITNRLKTQAELNLNPPVSSTTLQLIETLETQLITEKTISAPVEAPVNFEFTTENQPLIGIIDTGFSGDNPDIDYSRITWGQDHVDGDSDPTLTAGEGNEHGTHILGLIAAEQDNGIGIDGMNNNAPIWAGRAIGSGKWAESLIEFVDATIESEQPNAVVNLSLDLTQIDAEGNITTRYEFTPIERAALEYARQNNILIAVAAGNDGGVMSVLGQSSQEFDNIITVGAAEQFDPDTSVWKGADRADYSSYGYGLDITAYGGTLERPELSFTGDGIGTMSGTSVATAKVTGALSQVWAANPELNYRQVIEIVKNTATDLGETGFDQETGAGLLNIAAAVSLAKVTTGEEHYAPSSWIPDSWSGEGIVTPGERAVTFTHPIVTESFSGWVMPEIGVALRNSNQHEDRTDLAEPYKKTLSFDAWTYGERVLDYQLDTPDELWYRLSGTNYWVPSAYIYGFPGSRPPVLAPQPQPQPQTQPSYYPDLASLSDDQWNEYTKDNTRFDLGWPDFQDERHLTPKSIQDIYTDLSNEIFDTRYPMTAGYLLDPGYRNGLGIWHSGIDLAAPEGSAVKVPVGGTIVRGIQEIGGNYFIGVQGDDGKLWIYGHLGTVAVPSGRIEAGQVIGTIGSAAHLHLEVQQGPNYRLSQSADLNTVQNATLNPIKSFWELKNENATSSPTDPGNSVETFTGRVIATIGANVRSGPGTSYEDVGDRQYGDTISFDEVTTGESIDYPELGTATDQWYRIAGTNEWISAAIIDGSPPQPSVNNTVARPGEQQQYIIKPNDTLWGIAQRYLGDGNRWQEIMKTPEGGTFTEAEARNLQEGQSVYLPVIYQTGTGQPVTPPPSSTPQPSPDSDSGDGDSDGGNSGGDSDLPGGSIIEDLKQLQFELDNTSLWGSGKQGFHLGGDWRFDIGDEWSFGPGEFWVDMKGGLGAYVSSGTADIKLPGVFDFKYDNSSNQFTVSSNTGEGDTLFSSYLGLGAGIDFELASGIGINENIPIVGGTGFNFKSGFELDGVDVVLGSTIVAGLVATGVPLNIAKSIADSIDIDSGFNLVDREFDDSNQLEADDSAGININLTDALLKNLKFGSLNASEILGANLGVNFNQKSTLDFIGFHFDQNNDNKPDFHLNIGESISEKLTGNLNNLRVQPITQLKTTFSPQLIGNIGASFQSAIDSVIPDSTPQWLKELIKVNPSGVNFDINLTYPGLEYAVKEFNPFEVSNYWLPFK